MVKRLGVLLLAGVIGNGCVKDERASPAARLVADYIQEELVRYNGHKNQLASLLEAGGESAPGDVVREIRSAGWALHNITFDLREMESSTVLISDLPEYWEFGSLLDKALVLYGGEDRTGKALRHFKQRHKECYAFYPGRRSGIK